MKTTLSILTLSLCLGSLASASPERTRRQDAAHEVREYNVVPIENQPRLYRNGERTVYVDIYNCPKENSYRCELQTRKANEPLKEFN